MTAFVVTIDGPAGSGKSTTAREIARRLGYAHLDSGSLYRAYTHAALDLGLLRPGTDLDHRRLDELLRAPIDARIAERTLEITFRGTMLRNELRSDAVTAAVSAVSAIPEVRRKVNDTLRKAARAHGGGLVAEGRDAGSAVFPKAELKVFLTAEPEERARRRLHERGAPVSERDLEEEVRRLLERDRRDAARAASPFRRPQDAVDLDTTHLAPDEQAARIVEWARERGAPAAGPNSA